MGKCLGYPGKKQGERKYTGEEIATPEVSGITLPYDDFISSITAVPGYSTWFLS